jgi:hypothetical protein
MTVKKGSIQFLILGFMSSNRVVQMSFEIYFLYNTASKQPQQMYSNTNKRETERDNKARQNDFAILYSFRYIQSYDLCYMCMASAAWKRMPRSLRFTLIDFEVQ